MSKVEIQVDGEWYAFAMMTSKSDIDILVRVMEALSDTGDVS